MQLHYSLSTMRSSSNGLLRPMKLAIVFVGVLIASAGWMITGVFSQGGFGLQYNYYSQSCPNAESIALRTLQSSLFLDITAPAALLRLVFHDCQVQGCDASVLLQSNPSLVSEMVSDKNFGVRDLNFIDMIKANMESECPGKVSCADIIVMAGRDAVSISGGPHIDIQTGRRDGVYASNLKADTDLPSAMIDVDGLLQVFQPKGMTIEESVAIIGGGHTLGIGHCLSFLNRLYPDVDSSMNPFMAATLRFLCPTPTVSSNITFFPNDLTNVIFDNQYFRDLQGSRGLLTIDGHISSDLRTSGIVAAFAADQNYFFQTFSSAFLKLSSFQALTGTDGEIRADCRYVNAAGAASTKLTDPSYTGATMDPAIPSSPSTTIPN